MTHYIKETKHGYPSRPDTDEEVIFTGWSEPKEALNKDWWHQIDKPRRASLLFKKVFWSNWALLIWCILWFWIGFFVFKLPRMDDFDIMVLLAGMWIGCAITTLARGGFGK